MPVWRSAGCHESTDNIPGRDVIRGLLYGNSSSGVSIRIDMHVKVRIPQNVVLALTFPRTLTAMQPRRVTVRTEVCDYGQDFLCAPNPTVFCQNENCWYYSVVNSATLPDNRQNENCCDAFRLLDILYEMTISDLPQRGPSITITK